MSEETAVVNTTTEETTDTTNEKYSIRTDTLKKFGDLCRILTGNTDNSNLDNYYFKIDEMQGVIDWVYQEAETQRKLLELIFQAISASPELIGVLLRTAEGYKLKDFNDFYLTAKEEDNNI